MTSNTDDMQIVVFRVAGDQFALLTTIAREVVRYEQPRRLPGAPPWVRGVINLRGEIIPVCDLPTALGLPPSTVTPGKTIICDAGTGSVGLIVDEVTAVRAIARSEVTHHRDMLGHPGLVGVLRFDDELVMLLELEPLFNVDRALGSLATTSGSTTDDAQLPAQQEAA